MRFIRLNTIDIIFVIISLDSISINTGFGRLPFSLIGSFILLLKILIESPKIPKLSSYNFSLFSIGLFLTAISFFIGNSIIGNLSRIWILILIAYFLPNLKISVDQWAKSLKIL